MGWALPCRNSLRGKVNTEKINKAVQFERSMISALPGFEYFSLAMSIANVGYAWGCIGTDIWNLGDIYDDIYAVYGKKTNIMIGS